jgi:glc operon protein GlcG
MKSWIRALLMAVGAGLAMAVSAQPVPYGAPVSTENAKKIAAAALAEARNNKWNMAVAIVDSGGHLVYFEKADLVQFIAIDIAQAKARTAVGYRRASKVFQDDIEKGGVGLRYLSFPEIVASEGGELIVIDGRIVGAIGVSGGSGAQDGQVARAGLAAVK